MKKIFIYMLGCMSLLGFTACNDAESPVLPNAIYIAEAVDRDSYNCLDKPMANTTIYTTLRMTTKLDHPVTVTLKVDEEYLEEHNIEFEDVLKVLPDDNWVLYDSDGTPRAGKYIDVTFPANRTSVQLPVQIISTPAEDTNSYAIPLTIWNVSENIQVLENLKTACFSLQKPVNTWGVSLVGGAYIYKAFEKELPESRNWTVEFHVAIDLTIADNIFGQPLLGAACSTSAEGAYIRMYKSDGGFDLHVYGIFGVASFNSRVVTGKPVFTDLAYNGVWHHFALVCKEGTIRSYFDGIDTDAANMNERWQDARYWTSINIAWGWSSEYGTINHTSTLSYSEVRLWSVARSLDQLRRYKYEVNPESEGLVAYYRLNDCNDNLIKDYSPNGFDIDISDKQWKANEAEKPNQVKWVPIKSDDTFTSFVME